jgi:hypothetical protein
MLAVLPGPLRGRWRGRGEDKDHSLFEGRVCWGLAIPCWNLGGVLPGGDSEGLVALMVFFPCVGRTVLRV